MTTESIREVLGLACLACTALGIFETLSSARSARIGEVPDQGGRAGLAGGPDDFAAVTYYISLRLHYRKSANEVSTFSNCLLLVSVVAGLGINFVSDAWFGVGLIILSFLTLALALWALYQHNTASDRRLKDLANQRETFLVNFPTVDPLLDLRQYEDLIRRAR